MTIVDSAGVARSFPKPLTISQHTLRAVNAGDLSRREWAWLRIQSRLHSKEGRGFAMKLADHNVPIMTINGWTQRIIPPPKYHVQRLVPCELGSTTTIDQLYIIERGAPHHSMVPSPRPSWSCWRTPRTPTGSLPTATWPRPCRSVGSATTSCGSGSA